MAQGDPEDVVDLEPAEDADVEQQDLEAEEQETEPEQDEVDAAGEQNQDRQEPGEQRQQPTRGEQRHQRIANELREERQRRADLERRLDLALAARTAPTTQQGETPEARAQRLALLTPEERIREELQEFRREVAGTMQRTQFSSLDGNDRAAFQAKATVDPLYKKWEPKVEAELTQLRQQGMNVERERLMYYLIGKAAVEGRGATKPGQRAAAQQRVNAQRTRPSNSGSDVGAQRRERGTSLERRLENQPL